MSETTKPNWEHLLKTAVTEPGTISAAYSAFHDYSMGNQILAACQCNERSISIGPINTFVGWKAVGRNVKRGEKAISLCMPVTHKRKETDTQTGEEKDKVFTLFIYRNNWFVMSQTEGADVTPADLPNWKITTALETLNITQVEFTSANGNAMGYASNREVTVSPLNPMPIKTLIHEMAHVELGHTAEGKTMSEDERTPKDLREAEAESVALLCLESLGLPGADNCRGYIQSWYGHAPIPEKSCQRIFGAADRILKAGYQKAA